MRDNERSDPIRVHQILRGIRMEFSTQTTASAHQLKTPALAVGVFADGSLSQAADVVDRASGGALRAVLKSEFRAKPGSVLTLRNLPGVTAARVVLTGLGKPESYNARVHASAEAAFAQYCVQARLTDAVSALAAIECPDSTLQARAQAAAIAAGQAIYHYDATHGKPDRDAQPKLRKLSLAVAREHAAQAQAGLRAGRAISNGMLLTRQLGDLPGNVCTPAYLGQTA